MNEEEKRMEESETVQQLKEELRKAEEKKAKAKRIIKIVLACAAVVACVFGIYKYRKYKRDQRIERENKAIYAIYADMLNKRQEVKQAKDNPLKKDIQLIDPDRVYCTQYGERFHSHPGCPALANSEHVYYETLKSAIKYDNLLPCSRCVAEYD